MSAHVKEVAFSSINKSKAQCRRIGGKEEDVTEILCAAQLKELLGARSYDRINTHIKDVLKQHRKLFPKP